MRADAQRNREEIRKAALDVVRDRGLGIPLEDVARLAGVSKGTIYHRLGGRQGLIDAVVDDLVGECIDGIIARVEALTDPLERFEQYLRQIWLLQYDEPAANDVLIRMLPGSDQLTALCERARRFGRRLLEDAQAAASGAGRLRATAGRRPARPAPLTHRRFIAVARLTAEAWRAVVGSGVA